MDKVSKYVDIAKEGLFLYCTGLRIAPETTENDCLLVFYCYHGANLSRGGGGAANRVIGCDVVDLLFNFQAYVVAGIDLGGDTQRQRYVLALDIDPAVTTESAKGAQTTVSTESTKAA